MYSTALSIPANRADELYKSTLIDLLENGSHVYTRNVPCFSLIDAVECHFTETPLITFRKTAWKKALREMEWFLSSDPQCPNELLDWWSDQLYELRDRGGPCEYFYFYGYGAQFRHFGDTGFDQIRHLIDGIKEHPHSRRHVITAWNSADMANITKHNNNPSTPATCHGTVIQCFVRGLTLSLKTYQRSADILLGVPHNWLQYWGFLLWLCAQTGYQPGKLMWIFGDLHLYNDPTHIKVARAIADAPIREHSAKLVYRGRQGDEFKASDFAMEGEIPETVTDIRPRLF